MATQIRNGFLSPQVWVAKRESKVIEILGRLTPARVEYAENIFGTEAYMEGNMKKRDYSILTMMISDGKGSSRKSAKYNFNPNDFTALRRECEPSINYQRSYSREMTKMNCIDNVMTVRTVTIRFEYYKKKNGQYELDSKGQKQVSKYPWYIGITERTGTPDAKTSKIAKETNKAMAYILMTSDEYQSMLDSTCRYIDAFTMAFGPKLLRDKAKMAAERAKEYRQSQGRK